KLCGVDLSPDRFADGAIAQTSVARLSAIVIRHDVADMLAFFLLAETASAEYLWDCLDDAMKEFEGRVEDADAIWPAAEVQGTSQCRKRCSPRHSWATLSSGLRTRPCCAAARSSSMTCRSSRARCTPPYCGRRIRMPRSYLSTPARPCVSRAWRPSSPATTCWH